MRLIDADALKDKVNSLIDDSQIEKEDEFWNCAVKLCVEEIDKAPKVFDCRSCRNNGNDGECVDCYDYSNFVKYEKRLTGEWIPVSEKLPDDMQEVLVWFEYYRYGDYNCMYQTYGLCHVLDGKWSPFINGETGWQDARIISWMPLPKAYKEAENDT